LEAPIQSADQSTPDVLVTDGSLWPVRLERVGVLLVPVVVFVVLGARSLEPINGQDGYLYIGMVARLEDFLVRFPEAYYGMRFGYTLPSVAFTRVFGFELGHHLLRFLLLGIVCGLAGAGRVLTPRHAALAAVLFCASPLVLVSTFSTYTMSIGALCFVVGALVLARDGDGSSADTWRVGAGCIALAVAWNCHIVALLPSAAVIGVALVDRARVSGATRRTLFRGTCAAAAGSAFVVAVGVTTLWVRYGITDVYGPTLRQADRGAGDQFRYGGIGWLSYRHYLLVVPVGAIVGWMAWRSEDHPALRTLLRRMTLSTVAVSGVYVWFQWFRREPLLEMYFHSGPLLVLAVSTLAISVASVLQRARRWYLDLFAAAAVIACFYGGARVPTSLAVPSAFAVIVLAAVSVVGRRSPRVLDVGVVLLASATAWSTVSSPHDFPPTAGGYRVDPYYDIALFEYDATSMERAVILDELARSLPSLPKDRGQLMMWFDPRGPYDQMSAPFLWYLSGALQAPSDPPPPELSPTVLNNALVTRPRFIVVLDDDDQSVAQAAESLVDVAQYEYRWVNRLASGRTSIAVVLLERRAGTWQDFPCAGEGDLPILCELTIVGQSPQVGSSDQNTVSP
jgi:hypothetical protein